MGTIKILVGMIASGKTTWARKLAQGGALVVSHDDLTEMLHQEYRYDQSLHEVYHRAEEALVRIYLKAGRDAVVDRTHLTLKSRARWVRFARPLGCRIEALCFPVDRPEVHALRRFNHDARGFTLEKWERIARHHYEGYSPVTPEEGFDAVWDIV